MAKGFDNVSFTLKEKSNYITKHQRVFGGKKQKVFSYVYPKNSFEIKRDQLFFGATLDIKGVNISPTAERTLFTRIDKWFQENKRHKAVIVLWQKL
jgi:hypothetical protein